MAIETTIPQNAYFIHLWLRHRMTVNGGMPMAARAKTAYFMPYRELTVEMREVRRLMI